MERRPIYRDRYEVTEDDLNNGLIWAQEGLDHVAVDAIEAGRKYVGFTVSQLSLTQVSIAAGRLWFDGKRYFRNDAGGVTIDLIDKKPALQKRIVAIVAWPQAEDADTQDRDYEIDAETQTYEPRTVKIEHRRWTRLEAVGGTESVQPQPPTVEATAVVVAHVLMGTGGIETVTMLDSTKLANLALVAAQLAALKARVDAIEPQVSTLSSDLARLASEIDGVGDQALIYDMAADVARLKDEAKIPDSYVGYRANSFMDDTDSDTEALGYVARIEEGLRFAPEASASRQLERKNPYDLGVTVTGDGLMLPAYAEVSRALARGLSGSIALSQYAFENRTLVVMQPSRARTRFGNAFEISVNSTLWRSGQYFGANNLKVADETYKVYETGRKDPDGYRIVRLVNYWNDFVREPYWERETTEEVVLGYAWIETHLQAQDGWLTAIGPTITAKPADGTLYVGICECDGGRPDITRMICLVSVDVDDLVLSGPSKIGIPPTYLRAGRRYGTVLLTSADIWVASVETGNDAQITGTLFYGTNGGIFNADPAKHLMIGHWYARFDNNYVTIDLQDLELAGGITGIDINARTLISDNVELRYEVQIGGVWISLQEVTTTPLTGFPPSLQFRAVFIGTADFMPGVFLSDSDVTVTRPRTDLHHVSPERTLAASADTITTRTRLAGFDGDHHACDITLEVGGDTETPDVEDDRVLSDGTIERTSIFNLAAATTTYTPVIDFTTDSVLNLFHAAELVEIAN